MTAPTRPMTDARFLYLLSLLTPEEKQEVVAKIAEEESKK